MEHADIVSSLYAASANPQLWPSTLSSMVDYVGGVAGNIVYQAPDGKNSFLIPGRMREDLNALYLQQYTGNPYAKAFEKVAPNRVAIGNTLIDEVSVRKSAFYADICAPQQIFNQLFVPHSSLHEKGGIGGVALFLSRDQNEHINLAARKLELLTPHISRSIEISMHTMALDRETNLLQRLLGSLAEAAILLDANGEISLMNDQAELLLSQGDGIALSRHDRPALLAVTAGNPRAFVVAVRQAISIANGNSESFNGVVQVPRPSGLPAYLVRVTPLPPDSFTVWTANDSGARVLVEIVDPQHRAALQAEQLQKLLGLTAGETKVAKHIGYGLSVPQTAKILGLSPNTVKTHTSQLLMKAGVHSQAAFSRLMGSMPVTTRR